ncbi:hypothetical protein [Escherichia coli]|uniref:hypothetical protein n=1 Tax=Escherichia coli TaxID=562 RepID=UPI001C7D19FD|nr:hypothetical protein [Escherichia coli]EEW1865939.1 hypothetical protein [Escherichia coli]MDF7115799.1 hypothetical protein [Escherichia coli]HDX2898416.1 hypothetical protein [Escherichia coli]
MLEKDYQLSAYKKLAAAGGMKTPGAITSARNSANTAKLLAEELTGLILDTIVYPDTITSYVSTIRTTATGLTNIGGLATQHADLLAGYADLSMLLQLDIGWDVYCRANEREVSELPISIAIGDATTTKSLEDAVNALNTSSLVAAMEDINQTLNTGSGSSSGSDSGGGAVTPPPALTEQQVEALKEATEQFGAFFDQTTVPVAALQQQYERAKESASVAITAYNHAIDTALAEASANKASTASAVAALVPDSVLDELNKAAQ